MFGVMLVERVVALLVEPLWPFYAPLVPIDQVHKSLATLGGQTCNLWRENKVTVSAIQFATRCFPLNQVHKSLAALGGQTCNLWRENRDTVSAIQFGTRCKMFPN